MTLFPRLIRADAAPALFWDGKVLSFKELAGLCDRYQKELLRQDLKPGSRIAVWTHPSLETLVALTAHALYGHISIPLNPALGQKELSHILSDSRPSKIYHSKDGFSDPPTGPSEASGKSDLRLILYTSGTTGQPKGAMISATNIASNLDALRNAWQWSEKDVLVHALPLFHVHGLILGLFGSLRTGSTFHWIGKFQEEVVAQALASGGSMLFAVPTMYYRMAEKAEKNPEISKGLSHARLLVSGSAALSVRDHEKIQKLTGQSIYERYGLTETLINCAVPVSGPAMPGRVGPVLPGIELKLVDDQRQTLFVQDDQTIGEVAVRGPNVFMGYLNHPATREDWFYTGDLATRRADGSIKIVGRRATDLIKTGGFKVGAGEVEAALLEHPSISEAAVVGAPDEDLGEKIVAYVVAKEGSEKPSSKELIEFSSQALSHHKRPREILFVKELPRNAMGKVVKAQLKKT